MEARSAQGRVCGFTLLELLVVLMIMGLTVGLVSAVVRPDDRQVLRIEADRLSQLLQLAATEAQVSGKSIGWTSDGSGYRFWRVSDAGDWYDMGALDSELRRRALPHGMRITSLRVESMREGGTMRLEFGAYGFAPAFAIGMSFGDAKCAVVGSPVGEIHVRTGEAAPAG